MYSTKMRVNLPVPLSGVTRPLLHLAEKYNPPLTFDENHKKNIENHGKIMELKCCFSYMLQESS